MLRAMDGVSPEPESEREDERTPARSLYHKEKPSPISRSRPAAELPGAPPAPRRNRSNPALELMLANIRRFAVVLAVMGVVLLVSILALKFIWSIKDRELRAVHTMRPIPPPAADATNAVAEAAPTQAVTAASSKKELDTELIRRAVFLAKHGQALEESGSAAEAIGRYREALDVWPYLTAVWERLGRLYLMTHDYARAQIALEKAVENNPGSAELLNDLGVAYLYQGKVDKASNLFDAAVEVDPQYTASLFNLALCALTRNDRATARASLDRFLKFKPTDARALRESAFLDAMETKYPAALASLEAALAQAPEWPLLYFDAAAVTALMGRPEQAIRYLEKVEPLTSPSTVYRLYQEPAFRQIRLTELGKLFEKELAARARERMNPGEAPPDLHRPSEPITSIERADAPVSAGTPPVRAR